jgi:hypothetical protein
MNNHEQDYLKELTGLGIRQRKELTSYYARLPEKIKIEVHAIQTVFIRKNRPQFSKGKQAEFMFAQFILAIKKIRNLETGQAGKRELTPEEAKKITEIRVERIKSERKKKASPVRQLIEVRFYEEIKKLRQEGLSWREISKYIATHHKRRISHAYIQQTWESISRHDSEKKS